jgi:hypothetical protein
VEIGASLFAIVGVLIVGRVAYGVVDNLGREGWTDGARSMFLFLNSIVLVFGLFVLVLAYQMRRGRMWAWIVGLVLLPVTLLYGIVLTLVTALAAVGDVPWSGGGVVVTSLAALVALSVPRSVRNYFVPKPAPLPGGAYPVHHWVPGHPPA